MGRLGEVDDVEHDDGKHANADRKDEQIRKQAEDFADQLHSKSLSAASVDGRQNDLQRIVVGTDRRADTNIDDPADGIGKAVVDRYPQRHRQAGPGDVQTSVAAGVE